jgi:hypothetical protein
VEVVDRWQVLKNVRAVAERLLDRHRQDLRAVHVDRAGTRPRRRSAAEAVRRTPLRQRAAEFQAQVQHLATEGGTILGIARGLGVTRTMVRRSLVADAPPDREYAQRQSGPDPSEPHRRRGRAEGCRHALQRWREIREQGYAATSRQISRWAEDRRERDVSAPTMDRPWTIPRPPEADALRPRLSTPA